MKKSEISYQRFFQWSKQTNLELVLILMTLLRYMTGKYSQLVIKAELAARSAQRGPILIISAFAINTFRFVNLCLSNN